MRKAHTPQISVIVVNYNTAHLALDAVQSVLSRTHGGRAVDVHLVDNASPQGDGLLLSRELEQRGWSDRVTLHEEQQNLGFGHGNNVVLAKLAALPEPPAYVFLLNPDAQLKNEAIAVLADLLDAHPEVAAAGCRIEAENGVPVTAAFRFPSAIGTFVSALALSPISRLLGRWLVQMPPPTPTGAVDWVTGAAVMLRLSSVARAGYFDPTYFLYFEEVDLMRRLSHQSEQTWHVDDALATHLEGAATKVGGEHPERIRLPAYWYASWQHYFLKNHGRARALLAASAWYLGAGINWLVSSPRRRRLASPLHFRQDFWAVAVRPLLGLRALPYD